MPSSELISAVFLGVAVPLSTLAVVSANCGGANRRKHRKVVKSAKAQPGSSKKHQASISQKQGTKPSHVLSAKKPASQKLSSSQKPIPSQKLPSTQKSQSAKDSSKKKLSKSSAKRPSKRVSKSTVQLAQAPPERKEKSKKEVSAKSSSSSKKTDKTLPRGDSNQRIISKVLPKEKSKSTKKSVAAYGSDALDLKLEPKQLVFNITGGQERIEVHNSSDGNHYAIKLKCSDNEVYHFSPVHAIVEPGETLRISAYRNNTIDADSAASLPAKLVLLVAKVSKGERKAKKAFEDDASNYPKMVLPLFVNDGNKGNVGLSNKRCVCVM